MGPKKNPKRQEEQEDQFGDDNIDKLDEAIEEGINLDDEDESVSEGSGEDLVEEMEKYSSLKYIFL